MRVALALAFACSQAQSQVYDDYLRVADPCHPNNCVTPQICIRVKCDAGMCAQCTMTTFSTNPEDNLPGFPAVSPPSAPSLFSPSLAAPTPSNPQSPLLTRPPAPPSPGLVARTPTVQTQPASYPYVDPPGTPQQPASYPYVDPPSTPQQPASYPYVDPSSSSPYVDPSANPQLVPRTPPTPSLYSGAQDPYGSSPSTQLTPRAPQNSPYAPSVATPPDICAPRTSCQDCARDGMCGWDRGRCVVRCAVACVRDSTKCPPDTSCSSSTCSGCVSSGCVWSGNLCQQSCISAPCIGTVDSCPQTCTAGNCGDCTNAGCIWASTGCQSQCRDASCVALNSQCPRSSSSSSPYSSSSSSPYSSSSSSPYSSSSSPPSDMVCSQSKTCADCTSQRCKWSMNTCGSSCQRNQENNIICWDTVSMCPGTCITCNNPFPSCPPGCVQCQQIGQTCNACAKAVCLDASSSGSSSSSSSSGGCAIGLPCDACAASGCTWSISTGCTICRSPPCSSPCSPALPGTSPFLVPSTTSQTPTSCSNDGQCSSLQFCNLGTCQAYATAGNMCSLTGAPRCLPPAQCVYIGNPFLPENANINLLFCMKPGQDMSGLLSQVQQKAKALAAPPPTSQPTQPPTLPPQQQYQQQQYQAQQAQMLLLASPASPSISSPCCQNRSQAGCPADYVTQACVCALDSFCCATRWDGGCAELATRACGVQCQPQCDASTCGKCLGNGCRWVVPSNGSPGNCASSCSALAGWNCHTSSCPDPCLANPCGNGQRCSISNACDNPPCYTCSSQPVLKPGTCPAVGDCDVDYDSSECSVDSQCEGSSKCCMQPIIGGFVIQPTVRSFDGPPSKGKGSNNNSNSSSSKNISSNINSNKTNALSSTAVFRRSFDSCQLKCMLPNVQCSLSSDCMNTQYCSNSQCTDFLDVGMPCSSRTRCRSPLACTQGLCRTVAATTTTTTTTSTSSKTTVSKQQQQQQQQMTQPAQQLSCMSDDDCGGGQFCQDQPRGAVSICQPFHTEGLTCGDALPVWKCLQPLLCLSQGICRAPDYCASNADCPQTAQCVSNKCTPIKQSCCDENLGATGCTDNAVEACVCATDSSCCSVAWDKTCAKTAQEQCGATCQPAGSLWVAPGFGVDPCCGLQKIGGCGNISMDGNCACQVDNFCCDNTWDYKCINIASQKCGLVCPTT